MSFLIASPTVDEVAVILIFGLFAYGVMSTPALAICGQVKTTGRVPSVQELTDLLTGAAS